MQSISRVFREEAQGLEWILFRMTSIPGNADAKSWAKDREHSIYAGYIEDKGWKYWTNGSGPARWLIDTVEQGDVMWVGQLPAASDLPPSHK